MTLKGSMYADDIIHINIPQSIATKEFPQESI